MNLYSFVDPVFNPKMFYGYHDEQEDIVSKTSARRNARLSFFVVGGRRMGKTSLLLQARQSLQLLGPERSINGDQQVLIPIHLDVLKLGHFTRGEFFGVVSAMLARHLINMPLSFDIPQMVRAQLESVVTSGDPLGTLEDALHSLVEAARPHQLRIILLVDEMGRLMQREEGEIISLNLRALHTEPSLDYLFTYIFAGSCDEWRVVRVEGSPLVTILKGIELHVLDEDQSLALINEPTGGQLPPEVAQLVYLESGGHPFLLQYLMFILCGHENLCQLKPEDVFEASERFLEERVADFEHWGEKLGEIDKRVYEVFCHSRRVSVDELNSMMLSVPSQAGNGRQIVVDSSMILDSLQVLKTAGLIQELARADVYKLAGEMFARWFRKVTRR